MSSGFTAEAMAFLWYSGTATSPRSVSSNIMMRRTMSAFQNCPPWVSSTPFGRPVEPEVYGCMQTSSGATRTASNSGEAAASSDSYPRAPRGRSAVSPVSTSVRTPGTSALSRAAWSTSVRDATSTWASECSTQ